MKTLIVLVFMSAIGLLYTVYSYMENSINISEWKAFTIHAFCFWSIIYILIGLYYIKNTKD